VLKQELLKSFSPHSISPKGREVAAYYILKQKQNMNPKAMLKDYDKTFSSKRKRKKDEMYF